MPLFAAFRAGKAAAERQLINACLPRLTAILQRHFPVLPEEAAMDAADDALLDLIARPERFDPRRGSLLNYLLHIAEHRLLDEMRRIKRQKEIFVGGNVELAIVEANHYRETNDTEASAIDPDALPADVEALIETILPDRKDREAFAVLCRGRATVAEFATIWKLDGRRSPTRLERIDAVLARADLVSQTHFLDREMPFSPELHAIEAEADAFAWELLAPDALLCIRFPRLLATEESVAQVREALLQEFDLPPASAEAYARAWVGKRGETRTLLHRLGIA